MGTVPCGNQINQLEPSSRELDSVTVRKERTRQRKSLRIFVFQPLCIGFNSSSPNTSRSQDISKFRLILSLSGLHARLYLAGWVFFSTIIFRGTYRGYVLRCSR